MDETQLNAVKEILTKANLENLDKYKIYTVPIDENAPDALGLDSTEFVVSASACDSKMFEVPYNISVIQVNGEANIEAVRADLADGLRWSKYVHMPVDSALIAQKGDLVLCLMTTGDTYQNTAKAIAECGWENVIEYKK